LGHNEQFDRQYSEYVTIQHLTKVEADN